ncbi:hypothetical protein HK405_009225, partial [Cladochytrium tenue]
MARTQGRAHRRASSGSAVARVQPPPSAGLSREDDHHPEAPPPLPSISRPLTVRPASSAGGIGVPTRAWRGEVDDDDDDYEDSSEADRQQPAGPFGDLFHDEDIGTGRFLARHDVGLGRGRGALVGGTSLAGVGRPTGDLLADRLQAGRGAGLDLSGQSLDEPELVFDMSVDQDHRELG